MITEMPRVNAILKNTHYKNNLQKLTVLEQNRKFCKHNIEHFLDTARLMYLISFEENLSIDKEIIYATALLHDIGRTDEYDCGIPHDKASADFAGKILPDCGFSDIETDMITSAILVHREAFDSKDESSKLGKLLYRADKLSRNCFACDAENECYWSKAKKNFGIIL